MATVTITELTNNVTVEENTQNVTVSGGTQFPITVNYNATIIGSGDAALPEGGTAGQLLSKIDGTDYNVEWIDAPVTGLQNVVEDTTPQLGGNLDLNGHKLFYGNPSNNFINLDSQGLSVLVGQTGVVDSNINLSADNVFIASTDGPLTLSPSVKSGTAKIVLGQSGLQVLPATRTIRPDVAGNSNFVISTNFSGGVTNNSVELSSSAVNINSSTSGGINLIASSGNITINPTGLGKVVLSNQQFPASDGTAGQALVTDGAGNISWQTILNPTPGGSSTALTAIVQDLTPELGGELNVNDENITNYTTDGNVTITTNGTGRVVVNGLALPNSDGQAGQVLKTDGQGDLYWDDDEDTITIVSESQPQIAEIGEQWFNPTTQILKVYTAAGWVQVTADDLQF